MRRALAASVLGVAATLLVGGGAAALAQPVFEDVDGDGVPDPPEGFPGDFDLETGGAVTAEVADAVARVESLDRRSDEAFVDGQCGGLVVSYDQDGDLVDAIFRDRAGQGPLVDLHAEAGVTNGMTASNPFVVDSRGTVIYYGEAQNAAGDGPADHRWAIKTGGISLDAGGDDNPEGDNRNAGQVDLGANLPFPLTGIVKVTGTMSSQNGVSCEGVGFVEFTGPPGIATPIGAAGALLGGVGLIGLLFNSRPAITWKA